MHTSKQTHTYNEKQSNSSNSGSTQQLGARTQQLGAHTQHAWQRGARHTCGGPRARLTPERSRTRQENRPRDARGRAPPHACAIARKSASVSSYAQCSSDCRMTGDTLASSNARPDAATRFTWRVWFVPCVRCVCLYV